MFPSYDDRNYRFDATRSSLRETCNSGSQSARRIKKIDPLHVKNRSQGPVGKALRSTASTLSTLKMGLEVPREKGSGTKNAKRPLGRLVFGSCPLFPDLLDGARLQHPRILRLQPFPKWLRVNAKKGLSLR